MSLYDERTAQMNLEKSAHSGLIMCHLVRALWGREEDEGGVEEERGVVGSKEKFEE
jgi:hypothetical protein